MFGDPTQPRSQSPLYFRLLLSVSAVINMADMSADVLEDSKTDLQDSCNTFEYVSVQFPDSEKMQIVESEDVQVSPF